ncbi:MAG: hypothetical protein Q9169_007701 [Polycauliona sp. 2 TL-2023]
MSVPVSTSSKRTPTYPVDFCFVSPGAEPPVYIAGSFTFPEWQPHELQCSTIEKVSTASNVDTDYVFHRTFALPPGTYQYKFRLGHEGDWWVCDHNVDIVIDALGNQNNCLIVTGLPPKPEGPDSAAADETSYSEEAPANTGQPLEVHPAMNHLKAFSDKDKGDQKSIEGEPPAICNKGQTLSPSIASESLRRRKEASVDSSDSSTNESLNPPTTTWRNIVRLFLQCLQSFWAFLFRREAR